MPILALRPPLIAIALAMTMSVASARIPWGEAARRHGDAVAADDLARALAVAAEVDGAALNGQGAIHPDAAFAHLLRWRAYQAAGTLVLADQALQAYVDLVDRLADGVTLAEVTGQVALDTLEGVDMTAVVPLQLDAAEYALQRHGAGSLVLGRVQRALAFGLEQLHRHVWAERYRREALIAYERHLGANHAATARLTLELSTSLSALGRHADAVETARRALARAREAGETSLGIAQHLLAVGTELQYLSRDDEAAPYLTQAEAALALAGPAARMHVSSALAARAFTQAVLGQSGDAVATLREAQRLAESQFGQRSVEWIDASTRLAAALEQSGSIEEARDQALAASRKAIALLDIRHPTARLALRVFGSLASSYGSRSAGIGTLTLLIDRPVNPDGQPDPILMDALTARAVAHLSNGQLEPALADAEAARIEIDDRLGSAHRKAASARALLGAIWRDLGHPSIAIPLYKEAVAGFQSFRQRVAQFGVEASQSYRDAVGPTYQNLAELLVREGRLAEAQAVLDLLKEKEYAEFLRGDPEFNGSARPVPLTLAEQDLLIRYRDLSGRVVAMDLELKRLRARRPESQDAATVARAQALEAQLTEARRAFDLFRLDLRANLIASGPRGAAEAVDLAPSMVTDTQETVRDLGAGTALLQYFVTKDRVGMLLTTGSVQVARSVPVGERDLRKAIFEFRQALRRAGTDPLPAARRLHQWLIAPVEADLRRAGVRTLMLGLDGALRYVPFAALHDGQYYLIEQFALPMYSAAARASLRKPLGANGGIVAFGVTRGHREFSPLPAVRQEIDGITAAITSPGPRPMAFLDDEFTAERFRSVTRQPIRVLHVASHFRFSPGTEASSFLLLGDGSQLTLGQLRRENWRLDGVDLLTLSACETALGGGRAEGGEEIEGFAVLAQRQGTAAVLATLWSVADSSTAILMQETYRRRALEGVSKADALRQAQLMLLRGDRHRHPFHWAAFVLAGDWR